MITIIPDIHADLDRLEASLAAAADARPAFLGDFIDAGSNPGLRLDDRAVLERVRPLIDRGEAIAVMGNHELNAILYHRRGRDGDPLRKHSEKNRKQHQSFVESFGEATRDAMAWTDWFLEALPLWHEGDGFRLAHACWSDADIALIRARRPDARLRPEDLPEVAAKETPFARAVERITSGHEAMLPPGYRFHDKGGAERHEVRLSWWGTGRTWRKAALSVPDPGDLPDGPLPDGVLVPNLGAGLPWDHRPMLSYVLGGRAAELVVFGTPGGGSGGPDQACDLAMATRIAVALETSYGSGIDGLMWSPVDTARRISDPTLRRAVRRTLNTAEAKARHVLEHHRVLLLEMAKDLLRSGILEGPALQLWIDRISGDAPWDPEDPYGRRPAMTKAPSECADIIDLAAHRNANPCDSREPP